MALDRRYSESITQLRDTESSRLEEGGVKLTRTVVYHGQYTALKALRDSLLFTAKTTQLSPEDAGQGTLTVTYENPVDLPDDGGDPPPPVYEVIWQELRQPVEQAPPFSDLSNEDLQEIEEALSGEGDAPTEAGAKLNLYNLKRRGVNEYALGVPVVRATLSGLTTRPSAEKAWTRSSPPGEAGGPAGYEWMLTASEVRNDGETFTSVREWTGAETWDPILYPSS